MTIPVALSGEFLRSAYVVLAEEKRPLSAQEITQMALDRKYLSDKLVGKTPSQTMKAKLSVHIRSNGDQSPFVRTAPGRFALRADIDPGSEYVAPPLAPSPAREDVLVFPSDLLAGPLQFQGISENWRPFVEALLSSSACTYMARHDAERTAEYKQVLTYVLVTKGDRVLSFRRGNYNRADDFLRGANCVGFGGHVSFADLNLFSSSDMGLRANALRELGEELVLPDADRKRLANGKGIDIVAVINDDSSDNGRRHFAFVLRYEVQSLNDWKAPKRGEKSITQLRWLTPSSQTRIATFEYWSQLCIRALLTRIAVRLMHSSYAIRKRANLLNAHMVCVTGRIGSGKSVTTSILRDEYGYEEINSGQVLAKLLKVPPVPTTPRTTFDDLAWKFITKPNGPAELAAAIWKQAESIKSSRVVIDGIRQIETFRALQKAASGRKLGLVYVETAPDIAYELYVGRDRSSLAYRDFLKLLQSDVQSEVAGFKRSADAVLYNWFGKREFESAVRALMLDLGISPERNAE